MMNKDSCIIRDLIPGFPRFKIFNSLTAVDLGPIYSKGNSFRARAEARQREYRAQVLKAGWSQWGHWLDKSSAEAGANFVVPEAHLNA
jgi:hypothetical protein